ncbi:prepilin peptidase [Phenylobacterium sp.]|uniref:prepilin peptidase n=1 Tax=Phenylobacterium sp. TaxID=1871053 RepID=UPI0028113A73|nr:prepilin peptidase [Phenylobacterium sp.]
MASAWFAWGAVLLGPAAGLALDRLACRLGGCEGGPRRVWILVLACPALALWAQLVQPGATGFMGALLAWQLLLLARLDAQQFWLPLPLTLTLLATGLLAQAASGPEALFHGGVGAFAGWAALTAIAFAYRRLRGREGLGGGDAWLLAGGGAWTGWIALPTILVWAAAGGLVAVAALAASGRPVGRTQPLPFGVGLAFGIWLAWLYGPIGRA